MRRSGVDEELVSDRKDNRVLHLIGFLLSTNAGLLKLLYQPNVHGNFRAEKQ